MSWQGRGGATNQSEGYDMNALRKTATGVAITAVVALAVYGLTALQALAPLTAVR